jgi:hypothetical protein
MAVAEGERISAEPDLDSFVAKVILELPYFAIWKANITEFQRVIRKQMVVFREASERNLRQELEFRKRDAEIAEAQRSAGEECERNDCKKALLELAGAGYPTPAEGYGTNSSWAISDLCRCVRDLQGRLDSQK